MAQKLNGKVAIVTGASKGIGAAIAKHLAAEGAAVVVNYASSKKGADRVVAEIDGSGGKAVAVQGELAKKAEIERLFAETKKSLRQARHPRQQRGHLRVLSARRRNRRAFPQTLRPERSRSDPRFPGSGQAISIPTAAASSTSVRSQAPLLRRIPPFTAPPKQPSMP